MAQRPAKPISHSKLETAIDEFKEIVGEEYVYLSPTQKLPYAINMLPGGDIPPSAVVRPGGVKEIQKIVKTANRYQVPLWTISTGRDLGLGSACAVDRGNVILDLKRMNRILEVNVELAYALIEPGVTYEQLYTYLQENKIPLWLDCPAGPPTGGVVGNSMDRGAGYTPYGDHFLMSCGMEVVLADGRVLRTGMGALPGSKTWQIFKWGYGPYLDGIFTQSNFGIVTKLGVWLMPAPPAFEPFFLSLAEENQIKPVVDLLRPLKLGFVVPNGVAIANTLYVVGTLERYPWDQAQGRVPLPEELLHEYQVKHNIGAWVVAGAVYGTPEQVKVNMDIVKHQLGRLPNARFIPREEAEVHPALSYRIGLMKGVPTAHELGLYNWRGGGGDMWFVPTAPMAGSYAVEQMELAKKIVARHGIDYVAEFVFGVRDMHHVMAILYDRTQDEWRQKAKQCFRELVDAYAAAGYLTYRTNIEFQDAIMGKLDPLRSVCQDIKTALDPNRILSPGRYGIR